MHVTHSVLEFALERVWYLCECTYICLYLHVWVQVCLCSSVQGSLVLQSLLMQSFCPTIAGHHDLTLSGSIWGFLAPRWKISARKESQCPPQWTYGRIAAGYHCASRFSQIWNSGIWDVQTERRKIGLLCFIVSTLNLPLEKWLVWSSLNRICYIAKFFFKLNAN